MTMPHRLPPRRRRIRAFRLAFATLSLALMAAIAVTVTTLIAAAEISRFDGVERTALASAVLQVAIDKAGENPHFAPNPASGAVPICPGADPSSVKPLRLAFGWMRGTAEGLRLYEVLVNHEVCVEVDELSYALAYAQSRWSSTTGWAESRIVVDRALIRSGAAQQLAAVLVHEATHVDRVIDGTSCHLADDCRLLPNGVAIDEEIAAHAAEAEWWIEAFGTDGKRFAFGAQDLGENRVAEAYLDGEEAFRAYITEMRSDPREGEDF